MAGQIDQSLHLAAWGSLNSGLSPTEAVNSAKCACGHLRGSGSHDVCAHVWVCQFLSLSQLTTASVGVLAAFVALQKGPWFSFCI